MYCKTIPTEDVRRCFMNNLLVENFKSIMVYIRNYPDDSDLSQILIALEDAIQNIDNDILVNGIKRKMPKMTNWIQEGSDSVEYHGSPMVEKFLCDCLEILSEAVEQKNIQLIYDLSDMLQGIPDLKFWESSKNICDYWEIYVKPVKKKWKLDELRNIY